MVMIGSDPHKQTHTAVALNTTADVVGTRLVHARRGQVSELLSCADGLPIYSLVGRDEPAAILFILRSWLAHIPSIQYR